MALPVIAGLGAISAGVVSGISAFIASRAAWILAGLGVGFATMKGAQVVLGFIIADMNFVVDSLGSMGGSLPQFGHLGALMLRFTAYVGLFDALNIVIGGYMASYGFVATRVVLRRLQG